MGLLNGLMRRRGQRTLAFGTQPDDGFVGVALGTITVTGARPGATVTLTPATGSATGNTATANGSGVASFAALVLDTYAAAQTLTASAPGATDAVSDSFEVWWGRAIDSGALAWLIDEGSGQVVGEYFDGLLNGQLGSTSGSDTNDPSWVDEGLEFATNDYVLFGDVLKWERDQPRTVFTVGNFDSTGPGGAFVALVNKSKVTSPFTGYSLGFVLNKLVCSIIGYNPGPSVKYIERRSADNMPTGTWASVAFTYDGSRDAGGIQLYRDGAALAMTTFSNSGVGATSTDSTPLEFGARDGANGPLDGKLALVAMIPAEATPAQMVKLHNWARAIVAAAPKSITLPLAS